MTDEDVQKVIALAKKTSTKDIARVMADSNGAYSKLGPEAAVMVATVISVCARISFEHKEGRL